MFEDLDNKIYNYMNYTPPGTACEIDLHKIDMLTNLTESQKDQLLTMKVENEEALYSRIYILIDGPNGGQSTNWDF